MQAGLHPQPIFQRLRTSFFLKEGGPWSTVLPLPCLGSAWAELSLSFIRVRTLPHKLGLTQATGDCTTDCRLQSERHGDWPREWKSEKVGCNAQAFQGWGLLLCRCEWARADSGLSQAHDVLFPRVRPPPCPSTAVPASEGGSQGHVQWGEVRVPGQRPSSSRGGGGVAQGPGGWLCEPVAAPIGLSPLNLLL